ncbi:MAG: DinB family protein [Thermomicrobiales bacterium]
MSSHSPSHIVPGTTSWIVRMFEHHAWSNQVLIDFLSTLSDDQLALSVPGTYGDSLATIRHIVSSDADYVSILPDTPEVPQIAQDGPFEGWMRLREVAASADAALVDYVGGPADDYFFVDADEESGESFDLTRSMLLCQIIHHATEHRSQIRTTLSAHGITPPEISTWAWRTSEEGRAILARAASGDREASE